MALSKATRLKKLRTLAESEGFASVDDMLAASICDSVVPAICTAKGCDYTVEMEPDQDRGWCGACGRNSVVAAPVLAGII
ncbi:conserved hypothetical protein [Candidatus Defluviicoccus seviourii]|uniref:Uncharacterized protein n=1 Tax=Candidatus Defluviicoccus seviourii TaxID=2565273 RepID=A0A564WGF7_9PROT|nr:conserved hypothetical protein [Candidatus Defluviicoccus seviourii]